MLALLSLSHPSSHHSLPFFEGLFHLPLVLERLLLPPSPSEAAPSGEWGEGLLLPLPPKGERGRGGRGLLLPLLRSGVRRERDREEEGWERERDENSLRLFFFILLAS